MSLGFDLDHVALAALDTADALRFLTGELAGTVIFGGESIGFRPMQVWVGTTDGIVRLKGLGYDSSEKWEQGMTDAIEKNKPATASAKPGGR